MDTAGSFTTIDVSGAVYRSATGINNLCQIAGFYWFHTRQRLGQVQNCGFLRDTDGTSTTFDSPYLGSTRPNAIADNHMIAASFSHNRENEIPNRLVGKCLLCP